ncbi:porin [Thalassotalea crassostreae]|uniref:porin n=1 Tax=Thalassotalea crassostreae TaxID=1763536 RepID=UPI0008A46B29|nr:porin [Thalassotalea crassostreae]
MRSKLVKGAIASALIMAGLSQANAIEVMNNGTTSIDTRGWLRLSLHSTDDTDEFTDSGSRWGLNFNHKIENDWTVGVTYEWATNFEKNTNLKLTGDASLQNGSSGESLSSRLGFVHASHEKWGSIAVGKQWGVYYDIVNVTDVLNYFGGNATGVYNFNGDGGLSGTGRAEQAISWRKSYNNLNVALQLQMQDEPVDNEDGTFEIATMGNGYGLAVSYNFDNFTLGAAYNLNEIEFASGIPISNADDVATAISATYGSSAQGFHVAFSGVVSENHEIIENNIFMDATGSELYLRYSFESDIGVYGGYNLLESDESDNQYELYFSFVGADYKFENGFGLLFAEAKVNDNKTSLGADGDDSTEVAVGIRINL